MRPRLTRRVIDGLTAVESLAQADREVIGSDEPSAYQRRQLADLDEGLHYIRQLRAWYNRSHGTEKTVTATPSEIRKKLLK